jgi:hypothetical protein
MTDAIKLLLNSGLSVIPVGADKRPLIKWAEYQTRIATEAEADKWELPIAIVAGAVSGGITTLDFDDGGAMFAPWAELVKSTYPELPHRLVVQRTPSGGYHVVYRCPENCIENRKLCTKKVDGKQEIQIETRGEGGYFLCSPSPGYKLLRGSFDKICSVSVDESHAMLYAAVSLQVYTEEDEFGPPQELVEPMKRHGITPFDDYDAKNTPIDTLKKNGWSVSHTSGDKVYLVRPGKDGRGISASWNHVPGRFYVFSTSTEFQNNKVYKPSAVYTLLEHGGDFSAAAKHLSKDGYGEKEKPRVPVDYDLEPTTETIKASDFRQRIYKFYSGSSESGFRTGLHQFDDCLRFDRGYLNIVTGIPTHGKSEFVDFISVLLAVQHDWRYVVFSPENYPLEIHFNKLAEKHRNKNMWSATREEIDDSISFVDKHYTFIDATEDDLTLDTILSTCVDQKSRGPVDCLIIDPWNEIEHQKPKDVNDSDYAGICLRRLRKFARKYMVCVILVAHPAKMYREKESSQYPVPTLYDISGSANYYNKADNGLVVYRDFNRNLVEVHVKKVKYRNYGHLDTVKFRYDVSTGTYSEDKESVNEGLPND